MEEKLIIGDGDEGEHSISMGTIEGVGPVVWLHRPDQDPDAGLLIGVGGFRPTKWSAVIDAIDELEEHARKLQIMFDRACPPEDTSETPG